MNDDNGFGVPAGWYPDPLGLPQMRWWDNHGWTEHTTEARAPIVIQEAKLAWADDELPTRREMREREREANESAGHDDDGDSVGNADALLQLEPPSWDELPGDEPAPEIHLIPEFDAEPAVASAAVPAPATLAEPVASSFAPEATLTATPSDPELADTAFGATAATQFAPNFAPAEAFAQNDTVSTPIIDPAIAAAAAADPNPILVVAVEEPVHAGSANTAGAWILALIPLLQLVLTLLVVAAVGSGTTNTNIILGIWGAPYLLAIPFAIADQRRLKKNGYQRPASWAWVLLSVPIYLIARAIAVVMKSGNGFGPILVWGALALLQIGSIVAVPGLIISALPQVFAQQAEQSISHDATLIGAPGTVTCPAPPATVIGQDFTCHLARDGKDTLPVTASLQRENGWISWRVEDWGPVTLDR